MPVSNEFLHLRDFLRKTYNKEVQAWFKDLSNDLPDDGIPDNATGRKSAMRACLITAKDTITSVQIKLLTFRYQVQKVHERPEVFTAMQNENRVLRKGKPQIALYFRQDPDKAKPGESPIRAEISFRLMDKSVNDFRNMPNPLVSKYAREIFNKFCSNKGYLWTRGKGLWSYTELDRGYQFQIIASSVTEAQDLIKAAMAIQDHVPNWTYLNTVKAENPEDAYPSNPGTEKVLGETIKERERRKPAILRFQYATLYVPPARPRNLIDRTGRRVNPLVEIEQLI